MATRGRTSFQKKQRELARKEKQQRKAERREQKKLARHDAYASSSPEASEPRVAKTEARELSRAEQPHHWRPA
ncbi:MAG TPA: hypothetical protein VNN17_12690 [Terriglobia bacterium]|nr:hypothetical protein [Terriglobia bacterium]